MALAPRSFDRNSDRVAHLYENELQRFVDSTPASKALYERAVESMPLGVTSSFQKGDPHPIYLKSGKGSRLEDVDGNSYIDYHAGFGTMVVGHAHPKVREAIEKAAATGTHFAASTETAVLFAEEIKRRFGVDRVRFVNSGTEATMDAIRLARAVSGRDALLKIDGSYHGHHDSVMFAIGGNEEEGVPWKSSSFSRGIPQSIATETMVVPFNDIPALDRILTENSHRIGTLILEPIMMNIGIAMPRPGYLQAVRDLCDRHGVLLIFDEVKTGVTVAPGGATELFGVQPDLICLAKAVGGGTPVGAFAGKAEVMDEIANGVVAVGTFNGNPLSMAAGLATLTEVLTPDAYELFARLGSRLATGVQRALDEHSVPATVTDLGCKGAVTFSNKPIERLSDYLEVDDSLFGAFWYWMVNRGVFQTPGKDEQWTISVQHSEEDIDRFVEIFTGYCAAVAG